MSRIHRLPELAPEIHRARSNAWPYQGQAEDSLQNFFDHWHDLNVPTFLRVLKEGSGEDRLFAIFALGHLHPPEAEEVLTPLLQAADRRERWAATLSFGYWHRPEVLPTLWSFLLEEFTDLRPEFDWFLVWRWKLATLLGEWGDLRSVPALRQTLYTTLQLEDPGSPLFLPTLHSMIRDNMYILHDRIAYALGQLRAFGALVNLPMPPSRQRIALVFMALGSLSIINIHHVLDCPCGILVEHINRETTKRHDAAVMQELADRFGCSEEEQHDIVHHYPQDCRERCYQDSFERFLERQQQQHEEGSALE